MLFIEDNYLWKQTYQSFIMDSYLKNRYCTLSLSANELGVQTVANTMNIIIPDHKYARMEYTKPDRSFVTIDPETNEFIQV